MKPVGLISTGVLLLLLGTVAPTYAQQDRQQQDANAPKQEQQAKPEKKQQDKSAKRKQREQAKGQQEQQHKQQQAKGRQEQQRKQQQAKGQQEQQRKQQQARSQQEQQRKQQQAKGQQEQQRKQQQARSQQEQQRKQQQAKGRQEQQRQQQQARSQQEQQRKQQQAKGQQEQQRQARQQQAAWQQRRARNWQSEHRDWKQRGGYNADRIPEDRYRSNFGPDHAFRIYNNPVMVTGGYPGFQYGGYYFSVVDPWPQYWPNNWYENDDVYIDYSGDGYYLYNRRYPRDRIAISVYMNFVSQGDRRGVWMQHRARSWRSEHRTWRQRGGYNGYRIPANRFRLYFGRNHRFRIHNLPLVIVGGYPRFQCGGFWFSLVDPWPQYWSNDWYENDDMYIDYYRDGYYLYNRRYPRDRIAISVYVH
jgi:hypothetical protein